MSYKELQENLKTQVNTWLVTGVAGFIGSNLLETLLKLKQKVIGLDNFATGHQRNLDQVESLVSDQEWAAFKFFEGDIHSLNSCKEACEDIDYVLHQAALGSVPRSLENPIDSNDINVTGFLNMLVAARDAKVKRFVYAASSSTYGDHPDLPKVEDQIGKPLSPYAVTKYVNELYADVFSRCYDFHSIGLRYFNIFGPRQDPDGAYAAVIPKWVASLLAGDPVYINGDGETSRDFCFVENAIQANLLAAMSNDQDSVNEVYNVAVQERTSLNELFKIINGLLVQRGAITQGRQSVYREFRPGDVRHSLADVSKARRLLGYSPVYRIQDGLELTMDWYVENLAA